MKTHWRHLLDNEYFGAWDFDENEIKTFTIKNVTSRNIASIKGNPKKVIIEFLEDKKPMMANPTNLDRIGQLLGTHKHTLWIGQQISLHLEKARNPNEAGEMVDAIRVVRQKPAPIKKPIKPEDWDKALKAVEKGSASAQTLIDTRDLTPEQKEILQKYVK